MTTLAPTTPVPTTLGPVQCAIATSQVTPGADLDDVPLLVDLADLPAEWWANVNTSDGRRGRVYKRSGLRLAADWIEFDDVAETGKLRVRWSGTIPSGGVVQICIEPPRSDVAIEGDGDTYGRYATYRSEVILYSPKGGGTNRTANGDGTGNGGVAEGDSSGLVGTATSYDGSADYYTFGTAAAYERPTAITFMGMFNPTTISPANNQKVFGKWDDNGAQQQYLFSILTTGQLQSALRTDSPSLTTVVNSTSTLPSATWHHFGANWDGGGTGLVEQFLDGSVDATTGTHAQILAARASTPTLLGANLNSPTVFRFYGGLLQDLWFIEASLGGDWVTYEYEMVSDNSGFWGTWEYGEFPITTLPPTTPVPTTLGPTTTPPSTTPPTTSAPVYSLIDLTLAWEVPAPSIAITATRVRATNHDKQTQGWAHFDMGPGNEVGGTAGGAIGCRFEFIRTSGATFYTSGLVGFSTSRTGNHDGFLNNPTVAQMIGVRLNSNGSSVYNMHLVETDGTAFGQTNGSLSILLSTRYYCEFRYEPTLGTHGQIQLTIRTGSHAGTIVQSITRDLSAAHAGYRFFQPWLGSADFGSGSRQTTFDIDNVEIDGFTVQDSTTLEPTGMWPSQDFNAPKFTEVASGTVTFTRTNDELRWIDQNKEDDDYVYEVLDAPVQGDFNFIVQVEPFLGLTNNHNVGGLMALGTVPGSANVVGDAGEGYLGFGMICPGVIPSIAITEANGGVTARTDGSNGGISSVVQNFWVGDLDYDGGAGNGRASLYFRSGHPENVRSNDTITRDLAAQQVYTHFMPFSGWGNAGEGTRDTDSAILYQWVSFQTGSFSTLAPTTPAPTTAPPTTAEPTTTQPTTAAPTPAPTTLPPTTIGPTTLAPTVGPTTPIPGLLQTRPTIVLSWRPNSSTVLVRAWVENESRVTLPYALDIGSCTAQLRGPDGTVLSAVASSDPAGARYARLTFSNVNLVGDAHYLLNIVLVSTAGGYVARGSLPIPVRR